MAGIMGVVGFFRFGRAPGGDGCRKPHRCFATLRPWRASILTPLAHPGPARSACTISLQALGRMWRAFFHCFLSHQGQFLQGAALFTVVGSSRSQTAPR